MNWGECEQYTASAPRFKISKPARMASVCDEIDPCGMPALKKPVGAARRMASRLWSGSHDRI
jgi:hypothetical protein